MQILLHFAALRLAPVSRFAPGCFEANAAKALAMDRQRAEENKKEAKDRPKAMAVWPWLPFCGENGGGESKQNQLTPSDGDGFTKSMPSHGLGKVTGSLE